MSIITTNIKNGGTSAGPQSPPLEALPEAIAEQLSRGVRRVWLATQTTTSAMAILLGPEGWQSEWTSIPARTMRPITRATAPTSAASNPARDNDRARKREELLKRMSPEKRALYERIVSSREKTEPVKFSIVEALREMREDG